uniref:Vacuolar membrane protease n=2 Tax=Anthurium amnicola TaxID=1678845 RepID=A0A1D1YA17_9ARAE
MMRQRTRNSPAVSEPGQSATVDQKTCQSEDDKISFGRPAILFLALFIVLINASWAVYHFQFERLPVPLTAEQAGKRGFSEESAMQHVKALTRLGPHPVGSDALELALQYVLEASMRIKETAHWEVDVQVDLFHAKAGANRLVGALFKGKTLVYSDLKHVVLRILPKYLPEAEESAILISSHVDTVFSTEGAGDCSSCVSVMLELARGMSQWAHGFKNGVIFLFNTGEEEGLDGAHSFITQHPWRSTVRLAVDLEAMGIGGKSSIFQSGSDPWAIESFSGVAKYPSAQIIAQDLFLSGVIKSATDFQVYVEVAGLSGLDFAYSDMNAVYHTKNDKLKLLKPGSLQHLGENMLAFLLQAGRSSYLSKGDALEKEDAIVPEQTVFFDVLGMYMVVYRRRLASMLHNSVILQSLLIWTVSVLMGGYPAAIALGLSFLSIVLMWIFSISLSAMVAILLPVICPSPAPYIANPFLVVGLFGAPAVLGALTGQWLGFLILQKYLLHVSSKGRGSSVMPANSINWEAERWLFKSGFLQWFIALILGNIYMAGSTFLALVWLVSPAFAYGLIEATLTPVRSPKPLRIVTLLLGLALPILLSAGMLIRLVGTIIGLLVRFDTSPGSRPEWLGNMILAAFISAVVCLTFVYLLSYIHVSGAKKSIILSFFALFGLTLVAIFSGNFPTYTEDIARAVNVVHIVEMNRGNNGTMNPASYVSLFSMTPGKLEKEIETLKSEEFTCGRSKPLDLVTFTVHYGCWSSKDSRDGWSHEDIPILQVEGDSVTSVRTTHVSVNTRIATRWSLAINTAKIEDFTFGGDSRELVPLNNKTNVDGWHIIQFSGGKDSPTKFDLMLIWSKNATHSLQRASQGKEDSHLLLKLRTDVNRITPKTARILEKLPPWCALFGKSTSPYTLSFLTSLAIDF